MTVEEKKKFVILSKKIKPYSKKRQIIKINGKYYVVRELG